MAPTGKDFISFTSIKRPAYFTKPEMEAIRASIGDIDSFSELLDEESAECEAMAQQIIEEAGCNPDAPDTFPEELKEKVENLHALSAQLEYLHEFLDLGELMTANGLYVWRPPKDETGVILWKQEIEPPAMELFQSYRHTLGLRERLAEQKPPTDKEGNPEWNPELIFFTAGHKRLSKPLTVKTLCNDASLRGEINDLNKDVFKATFNLLHSIYEHERILLDSNNSQLPQILETLASPHIQSLCKEDNGLSPN